MARPRRHNLYFPKDGEGVPHESEHASLVRQNQRFCDAMLTAMARGEERLRLPAAKEDC